MITTYLVSYHRLNKDRPEIPGWDKRLLAIKGVEEIPLDPKLAKLRDVPPVSVEVLMGQGTLARAMREMGPTFTFYDCDARKVVK